MKYSCVRLYVRYTKNSLLLNQHNGDDAPQKKKKDKVNFWCKWQQMFPKYHLNRLNSRVDSSDYMLQTLLTIWNLSRFIQIFEHSMLWFCPAVLKMMYWIWMLGNFCCIICSFALIIVIWVHLLQMQTSTQLKPHQRYIYDTAYSAVFYAL